MVTFIQLCFLSYESLHYFHLLSLLGIVLFLCLDFFTKSTQTTYICGTEVSKKFTLQQCKQFQIQYEAFSRLDYGLATNYLLLPLSLPHRNLPPHLIEIWLGHMTCFNRQNVSRVAYAKAWNVFVKKDLALVILLLPRKKIHTRCHAGFRRMKAMHHRSGTNTWTGATLILDFQLTHRGSWNSWNSCLLFWVL